LLFAMGRRDLLDARLAEVHPRYRTPKAAVLFVGLITVLASFLGQAVLVPISDVGSLASALGWLATCLAFCKGAGQAVTPRSRSIGIIGAIIAAIFIAMKLVPAIPGSFREYEYLALGVWVIIGLALWWRRAAR
jgi:amino acid transporter